MMQNFNKFYSKVSAMADEQLVVKKPKPSKGLLAKSDMSPKDVQQNKDVYNQVAQYIAAIRKQKQEIMNGKS
jgi:hypothetical protein